MANERDSERMAHYTVMLNDAENEASQLRTRYKMLQDDERRYGKENGELADLIEKTRNVSFY